MTYKNSCISTTVGTKHCSNVTITKQNQFIKVTGLANYTVGSCCSKLSEISLEILTNFTLVLNVLEMYVGLADHGFESKRKIFS